MSASGRLGYRSVATATVFNVVEAVVLTGVFVVAAFLILQQNSDGALARENRASYLVELACAAALVLPVPWIVVAADALLLVAIARDKTWARFAAIVRIGVAVLALGGLLILVTGDLLVGVVAGAGIRHAHEGEQARAFLETAAPGIVVAVVAVLVELVAIHGAVRVLRQRAAALDAGRAPG